MNKPVPWRVGQGWDRHRLTLLAGGRPLKLGGVTIPSDLRVQAHSDGDVLLHALMDALLGASALGDLGRWFPDTDPKHFGADSGELLKQVLAGLGQRGLRVVQADLTCLLERPKLSSWASAIRTRVAELLEIPIENVGFKAKTGEGLGPVGTRQAVEALACVLLTTTPA